MVRDSRRPPPGVLVVLVFGFVLLAGLGLTLPLVVGEAVESPVSPLGLLWMLLLAYLIFTLTLILQRKQAAWMLSIGLATLTVPLAIVMYWWASLIGGLVGILLVVVVFASLRGSAVRGWFSEP
jgi:hypothetical protein